VDNRQVKEILALYRPGIDDDSDPLFAEAFSQVRHDPELARWLEWQQGVDTALRRKLGQIAVPPGLEQQILSERRSARPTVRPKRRVAFVFAAAAVAVALAVVAGHLLRPPEPPDFGAYRNHMATLVSGEYKMMLETKDLNAVRQFLAANHGPADYVLTPELEKVPAEGCALIDWHGQRVSLVCFDRGEDNDLFLFIIGRSALPDPPPGPDARFSRVGPMTTASWTVGDRVYVLASKGDEGYLRKFL
jgi:hypothetical protein